MQSAAAGNASSPTAAGSLTAEADDATGAAAAASQPLRYGSRVTLYERALRGYVSATNEMEIQVGIRLDQPAQVRVFEDAVFLIESGEMSESGAPHRQDGEVVRYGQVISLRSHTHRQPLAYHAELHATRVKTNLRVTLVKTSSASSASRRSARWRIMPRFRLRVEGLPVEEGDPVLLQSDDGEHYLNVPRVTRRDEHETRYTGEFYEASCGTVLQAFEVGLYDGDVGAYIPPNALRCGDFVTFFHKEKAKYLYADLEHRRCVLRALTTADTANNDVVLAPRVEAGDYANNAANNSSNTSYSSDGARHDSNSTSPLFAAAHHVLTRRDVGYRCIFVLEAADPHHGGALYARTSADLYRLKTISQKFYLQVPRKPQHDAHKKDNEKEAKGVVKKRKKKGRRRHASPVKADEEVPQTTRAASHAHPAPVTRRDDDDDGNNNNISSSGESSGTSTPTRNSSSRRSERSSRSSSSSNRSRSTSTSASKTSAAAHSDDAQSDADSAKDGPTLRLTDNINAPGTLFRGHTAAAPRTPYLCSGDNVFMEVMDEEYGPLWLVGGNQPVVYSSDSDDDDNNKNVARGAQSHRPAAAPVADHTREDVTGDNKEEEAEDKKDVATTAPTAQGGNARHDDGEGGGRERKEDTQHNSKKDDNDDDDNDDRKSEGSEGSEDAGQALVHVQTVASLTMAADANADSAFFAQRARATHDMMIIRGLSPSAMEEVGTIRTLMQPLERYVVRMPTSLFRFPLIRRVKANVDHLLDFCHRPMAPVALSQVTGLGGSSAEATMTGGSAADNTASAGGLLEGGSGLSASGSTGANHPHRAGDGGSGGVNFTGDEAGDDLALLIDRRNVIGRVINPLLQRKLFLQGVPELLLRVLRATMDHPSFSLHELRAVRTLTPATMTAAERSHAAPEAEALAEARGMSGARQRLTPRLYIKLNDLVDACFDLFARIVDGRAPYAEVFSPDADFVLHCTPYVPSALRCLAVLYNHNKALVQLPGAQHRLRFLLRLLLRRGPEQAEVMRVIRLFALCGEEPMARAQAAILDFLRDDRLARRLLCPVHYRLPFTPHAVAVNTEAAQGDATAALVDAVAAMQSAEARAATPALAAAITNSNDDNAETNEPVDEAAFSQASASVVTRSVTAPAAAAAQEEAMCVASPSDAAAQLTCVAEAAQEAIVPPPRPPQLVGMSPAEPCAAAEGNAVVAETVLVGIPLEIFASAEQRRQQQQQQQQQQQEAQTNASAAEEQMAYRSSGSVYSTQLVSLLAQGGDADGLIHFPLDGLSAVMVDWPEVKDIFVPFLIAQLRLFAALVTGPHGLPSRPLITRWISPQVLLAYVHQYALLPPLFHAALVELYRCLLVEHDGETMSEVEGDQQQQQQQSPVHGPRRPLRLTEQLRHIQLVVEDGNRDVVHNVLDEDEDAYYNYGDGGTALRATSATTCASPGSSPSYDDYAVQTCVSSGQFMASGTGSPLTTTTTTTMFAGHNKLALQTAKKYVLHFLRAVRLGGETAKAEQFVSTLRLTEALVDARVIAMADYEDLAVQLARCLDPTQNDRSTYLETRNVYECKLLCLRTLHTMASATLGRDALRLVTHFRDGTPLPLASQLLYWGDPALWRRLAANYRDSGGAVRLPSPHAWLRLGHWGARERARLEAYLLSSTSPSTAATSQHSLEEDAMMVEERRRPAQELGGLAELLTALLELSVRCGSVQVQQRSVALFLRLTDYYHELYRAASRVQLLQLPESLGFYGPIHRVAAALRRACVHGMQHRSCRGRVHRAVAALQEMLGRAQAMTSEAPEAGQATRSAPPALLSSSTSPSSSSRAAVLRAELLSMMRHVELPLLFVHVLRGMPIPLSDDCRTLIDQIVALLLSLLRNDEHMQQRLRLHLAACSLAPLTTLQPSVLTLMYTVYVAQGDERVAVPPCVLAGVVQCLYTRHMALLALRFLVDLLSMTSATGQPIVRRHQAVWRAVISDQRALRQIQLRRAWCTGAACGLRDRLLRHAVTSASAGLSGVNAEHLSITHDLHFHLGLCEMLYLIANENELVLPEEVRQEVFGLGSVDALFEVAADAQLPVFFRRAYVSLTQCLLLDDPKALPAVFAHRQLVNFLRLCLTDVVRCLQLCRRDAASGALALTFDAAVASNGDVQNGREGGDGVYPSASSQGTDDATAMAAGETCVGSAASCRALEREFTHVGRDETQHMAQAQNSTAFYLGFVFGPLTGCLRRICRSFSTSVIRLDNLLRSELRLCINEVLDGYYSLVQELLRLQQGPHQHPAATPTRTTKRSTSAEEEEEEEMQGGVSVRGWTVRQVRDAHECMEVAKTEGFHGTARWRNADGFVALFAQLETYVRALRAATRMASPHHKGNEMHGGAMVTVPQPVAMNTTALFLQQTHSELPFLRPFSPFLFWTSGPGSGRDRGADGVHLTRLKPHAARGAVSAGDGGMIVIPFVDSERHVSAHHHGPTTRAMPPQTTSREVGLAQQVVTSLQRRGARTTNNNNHNNDTGDAQMYTTRAVGAMTGADEGAHVGTGSGSSNAHAAQHTSDAAASLTGDEVDDETRNAQWMAYLRRYLLENMNLREENEAVSAAGVLLRNGDRGNAFLLHLFTFFPVMDTAQLARVFNIIRQAVTLRPNHPYDDSAFLPRRSITHDLHGLFLEMPSLGRQNFLARWQGDAASEGALPLIAIVTEAVGAAEAELRHAALLTGVTLLAGGNRRMQEVYAHYCQRSPGERLFLVIRDHLHNFADELRVYCRAREQGGHALDESYVLEHLQTCMQELQLLQLLCAQQFAPIQRYLLEQPEHNVSVNLIEALVQLLAMIARAADEVTTTFFLQLLRTVCETLQGPCRENQENLVAYNAAHHLTCLFAGSWPAFSPLSTPQERRSALQSVEEVPRRPPVLRWGRWRHVVELENRPEAPTATQLRRQHATRLYNAALATLLALIEGRDEPAFIRKLLLTVDLTVLARRMDYSAAAYERRHGSILRRSSRGLLHGDLTGSWTALRLYLHDWLYNDFPTGREETQDELSLGINIYIFFRACYDMQYIAVTQAVRGEWGGVNAQRPAATLHALDEFVDQTGRTIRAVLSRSTAYKKLSSKVAKVEIVRNGALESVYFRILRACQDNLYQRSRDAVIRDAVRTSDNERIQFFFRRSFALIVEVETYARMRSYALLYLFNYFLAEINLVAMLLVIAINLLMIIGLRAPVSPYHDGISDNMLSAMRTVGIVLIIVQGIVVLQALTGTATVRYFAKWHAWRRAQLETVMRRARSDVVLDRKELLRRNTQLRALPWYIRVARSIYYICTDYYLCLQSFYLLVSIMGLVNHKIWYALQLTQITLNSPIVDNLFGALTQNVYVLIMTFVLVLFVIFFFSTISFYFFSDLFDPLGTRGNGFNCYTLAQCWLVHLDTLRIGGGIGELAAWPTFYSKDGFGYWFSFFRLSYYVVISLILTNLFFGTIVDSLASFRQRRQRIRVDQETKCFICGIARNLFDVVHPGTYDVHISEEHNMWEYVYFLHYLSQKDPATYSGQEAYVAQLVELLDITFYPIGRALVLASRTRTTAPVRVSTTSSVPRLMNSVTTAIHMTGAVTAGETQIGTLNNTAANTTTTAAATAALPSVASAIGAATATAAAAATAVPASVASDEHTVATEAIVQRYMGPLESRLNEHSNALRQILTLLRASTGTLAAELAQGTVPPPNSTAPPPPTGVRGGAAAPVVFVETAAPAVGPIEPSTAPPQPPPPLPTDPPSKAAAPSSKPFQ